ncbi:uncharacterized protein M421DRAFT_2789 [Didymella exigua CBS 183.55]|uniref:Uncharacterized protein n=1 Tax=Didymella exigua CBS 183.55 TaxID=1150837 RepID=A0A6A5RS60_9PLEO|nr:uncharacterized protein M421DRAFT_2789 [Didymella exigua CBS 183.55]KAF1931281.1 hypothetical protein M421DRAFT_2789 [Didymella exigua CBS 183.55]
MVGRLSMKTKKTVQSGQNSLTEKNLRLHSSTYTNCTASQDRLCDQDRKWAESSELYRFEDDLSESGDEDLDTRRYNIALRKAASLEAMKIYGGCFTSGFLAMTHGDLDNRKMSCPDAEGIDLQRLAVEMARVDTGSIETGSRSSDSCGSPRPDSDTLSRVDTRERSEKKWSWRSLGKKRRCERNAA